LKLKTNRQGFINRKDLERDLIQLNPMTPKKNVCLSDFQFNKVFPERTTESETRTISVRTRIWTIPHGLIIVILAVIRVETGRSSSRQQNSLEYKIIDIIYDSEISKWSLSPSTLSLDRLL